MDWSISSPEILQREIPQKSDQYIDIREQMLRGTLGNGRTENFPTYRNVDAPDDIVNKSAREFGVDPYFIRAIIKQESGGNHKAVSKKGALGSMQLMPATLAEQARELGYTDYDAFDANTNIRIGTYYFSKMMKQFGSPTLALAAYNAGPGNVRKHKGIPPFKETQQYVRKVMNGAEDERQTDQAVAKYGLTRGRLNGTDLILSPDLYNVLVKANNEMIRDGKKGLRINSSFRTNRQQTDIHNRSLRDGFLAARPGKSRHERGLAVDINNYQEAMPYLKKYGVHNPFISKKDPVHFQFME